LDITAVVVGAFATVKRHPALLFSASSVMVLVPNVVAYLVLWGSRKGFGSIPPPPTGSEVLSLFFLGVGGGFLVLLLLVAPQVFLVGLTAIVVSQAVLGKPITAGQALAHLKSRLLPLLAVTLLHTAAAMTLLAGFLIQIPASIFELNSSMTFMPTGEQRISYWTFAPSMVSKIVAHVVTYPFFAVVVTLLYIDRRIVRERLDLQLVHAAA
jgi:hypothetical protein